MLVLVPVPVPVPVPMPVLVLVLVLVPVPVPVLVPVPEKNAFCGFSDFCHFGPDLCRNQRFVKEKYKENGASQIRSFYVSRITYFTY